MRCNEITGDSRIRTLKPALVRAPGPGSARLSCFLVACLQVALLVLSPATAGDGEPNRRVCTHKMPPEITVFMFNAYKLPIPCPEVPSEHKHFWGVSNPSNNHWSLVGVTAAKRGMGRANADGQRPRCKGAWSPLFLCGPSGPPVELPQARGGVVSDNGVVALFEDHRMLFFDRFGESLGHADEHWVVFRDGMIRAGGGFVPGTDNLIRFGVMSHSGKAVPAVRCTNSDGELLWEYRARERVTDVHVSEGGFFRVSAGKSDVLLNAVGIPVEE